MRPQPSPSPGGRPGPRPHQPHHHWAPLPVVLAGTFMVVLDFFIVNVALPSMQSDLHASSGAIEWVVAGYALTSAVFLIILSLIGVLYRGPDRVRALSLYGTVMGLAAIGGQLIGGGLVAADVAGLGWRSCFLINIPIGALALVLAPRLIPESRDHGAAGLDLSGTALVTAALTAVVLPLVEGQAHDWPVWTWISLGAALVGLGVFVLQQRRLARAGGAPLLELSLFAERSFSAGLLTQLGFWCGQASFFVVLALYLQHGRGLRPLQSGLVFTILAAAYVTASMLAPALTKRYGRRVIGGGALVLASGHGLLLVAVADVGVGGSIAELVPGLLLVGAGMGLVLAPLATTILQTLEPERAGAASGMLTTMQGVGGAIGVAVTGAIFFGALHAGYARAFELSVAALAGLLVAVAGLTRLLPARTAAPAPATAAPATATPATAAPATATPATAAPATATRRGSLPCTRSGPWRPRRWKPCGRRSTASCARTSPIRRWPSTAAITCSPPTTRSANFSTGSRSSCSSRPPTHYESRCTLGAWRRVR